MRFLTRRAALLSPLLLASCGDDDPPPRQSRRDFPPLRYGYLPPINLNVQRVEMAEGFMPPAGNGEISDTSPVNFAETLFAMARDRLRPVGTAGGTATFSIQAASIVRRGNTMNGTLAIRLDVRSEDGAATGYAEAHVIANRTGSIDDQPALVYDMLKSMMKDMNVEMEFQIRNQLRVWLVDPTSAPPGPPASPPLPTDPPRG
jgi:hypothetical protein